MLGVLVMVKQVRLTCLTRGQSCLVFHCGLIFTANGVVCLLDSKWANRPANLKQLLLWVINFYFLLLAQDQSSKLWSVILDIDPIWLVVNNCMAPRNRYIVHSNLGIVAPSHLKTCVSVRKIKPLHKNCKTQKCQKWLYLLIWVSVQTL